MVSEKIISLCLYLCHIKGRRRVCSSRICGACDIGADGEILSYVKFDCTVFLDEAGGDWEKVAILVRISKYFYEK